MAETHSEVRKRRLHEVNRNTENMSAAEKKVDKLEKTLNEFRSEVDAKLKILQQILTTRNEQVAVQKELLAQEQALYDTLLGQWQTSSNQTEQDSDPDPDFTQRHEETNFGNVVIKTEPGYLEASYDCSEGESEPFPKKSKSSLRRQRKSKTSIRSDGQNVDIETTGHGGSDHHDTFTDQSNDQDDPEAEAYSLPVEVQMNCEVDDIAAQVSAAIKFPEFQRYQDNIEQNGSFNLMHLAHTSRGFDLAAGSNNTLNTTNALPRCTSVRAGVVCGTELREATRKNRKGNIIPCYRCPKRGCQSYCSITKTTQQMQRCEPSSFVDQASIFQDFFLEPQHPAIDPLASLVPDK